MYSTPSVYAVAVANQNSRKSNSRYTSHSVDKIIVQKCQKNFYKALYIVLIEIFLDRIKKPCNRKPRNGKPRKTRDYCSLDRCM